MPEVLSEGQLDMILQAADMAARMGARSFQIGWTTDDVPIEEMGWYAHAQFRGARITAESTGPAEACDALVKQLQERATCFACRRTVAWGKRERARLLSEGTPYCPWKVKAGRWEPGCP